MSSSAPASAPSLLPGQRPPLYTVTATDQAGVIVNVAAFCVVVAAISVFIRGYVRFGINRLRYAWDDGVVTLALVFFIIQSIFVFAEIRDGLGKTMSQVDVDRRSRLQKLLYADDVLYVLSVWTSKIAVALLFSQMAARSRFGWTSQGTIAFTALTGVVCVLLVTLRCELSQPWIWFGAQSRHTCAAELYLHWQVIAALDIVSELLLAGITFCLIWPLNMGLSAKLSLSFLISLRLLLIAPIVSHLHYLREAVYATDPTLKATTFVICKQAEIAYAIIAANLAALRPFILATATNYGAAADGPKTAGSGSNSKNRSINFMRRMRKSQRSQSRSNDTPENDPSRTDYNDTRRILSRSNTDAHITAGGSHDSMERRSLDSEQMTIRKDVRYDVAYDDGARKA